jgi:hypothetical protein
MPALFGFILGVLATIGGAYLYDAASGRAPNGLTPTAASGQAPMVNWDVVTNDWHTFAVTVQNTANNLEKRFSGHAG